MGRWSIFAQDVTAGINLTADKKRGSRPQTSSGTLEAIAGQLFRLIESFEDFLLRRFYNYVSFAGYTDYHGSDLESWRAILRRIVTRFLSYLRESDSPEEISINEEISRNRAGADGASEAQDYYQRGFLLGRILGIIKYSRDSFLNLADSGIPNARDREKACILIWRYFDKFEIGFVHEWVNLELGSHRMLEVNPPGSLSTERQQHSEQSRDIKR